MKVGEPGYKIVSVDSSAPSTEQAQGELFPCAGTHEDRLEFQRRIEAKSLDIFGRIVSGGMMGGYLEKDFPLYYINQSMLKHLGYTDEKEFVDDTGGYVINCMHPLDRQRVDQTVEQAFADGDEYTVEYRMKKKDGSYIWVHDVGKKGLDQDGKPMCISVIRDITREVASKERLEKDALEKKKQADRYNKLFESVLCGIVQYRLDEQGSVIFENANREAIRIFGYEQEEFWKKDDWDLPALIVEEDRARILEEVGSLREVGDKKSYEYRVCRKDGQPCWIIGSAEVLLNNEGDQIIQSVFLDINDRKKTQEQNRLLANQVEASNRVLQLALEHTTTCEFFYYPFERQCILPSRLCEMYGTREEYKNAPESLAKSFVAPEFREDFCALFENVRMGEKADSMEFPTSMGGQWCRVTLTVISCREDQQAELIIGILEDITHQKEMEQALEDARSRDSLTGLYNKETGIRIVQEYMEKRPESQCCCMMLLDMDDFKQINAEEGTAFGDVILQETAAILTQETGREDIQARIGGDEFLLFVKNCNRAGASQIGPRIAELVKGIVAWPKKQFQISVSIGMCVTDVAQDYNLLYRCAESALKYVKENGKGSAACYLDTSNELGIKLTQLYTEEHPLNTIDRTQPHGDEDLVSFALELLGKSKKLDDAVFLLLSRVGKSFHLDRVSILEADRDLLSMHFSYQWARRRKDFMLGQEFYVTGREIYDMAHSYDREGLSAANPNPSVYIHPSGLHAGIWDGGDFIGEMSFEVLEEGYQWTDDQRKLLKELVKIVPSFFMKAKANAVSQAKTDFLSRMSHEIRTPMNAISGMTTIAKSVLDDKKKTLECLEKIESANTYLINLINDILDMSRIESGKVEINYEAINMEQILVNLGDMLRPQAQAKGVRLYIEYDYKENRLLSGDELRLSQVLINIIGNAIKFTEQEGSVTVTVREAGKRAEEGVSLYFSVADTGIGIEPSAMKRIFNVFEQADRGTAARHGGTGLGLAISSNLVQLMGGTLRVNSQLGLGSQFYFTLPFLYAAKGETRHQERENKGGTRNFKGKRLLLAEDNDLNQEIARTILEMEGFVIECANDGSQAVAMFLDHEAGYYDGILMDIRMPVMDGLQAARRIRTLGRPDSRLVPIIALTANAFDEDSRKSLESGMNGHLSKPIETEELLKMLGDVLR